MSRPGCPDPVPRDGPVVNGELLTRTALSASDERAMFGLFRRYFPTCIEAQFAQDLREKGWIVLLREDDQIRGFTSLDLYDIEFRGETIGIVYSGDTIVDPRATGLGSVLSRSWIGAVNRLRKESAGDRLLWFLLVSGYRTYRFLPLFWREFHPRFDVPTPEGTQALIDHLADARFGSQYVQPEGVVRLEAPTVLCDSLRRLPVRRLQDPHVAFFATRNPGHVRGDELVCLADLSRSNLTPAGERMWQAAARHSAGG